MDSSDSWGRSCNVRYFEEKQRKYPLCFFSQNKNLTSVFPAYTQGTLEWHKMAEEVYDSGR